MSGTETRFGTRAPRPWPLVHPPTRRTPSPTACERLSKHGALVTTRGLHARLVAASADIALAGLLLTVLSPDSQDREGPTVNMWSAPSEEASIDEASRATTGPLNRPHPPLPHQRSYSASESHEQHLWDPEHRQAPWRSNRSDTHLVDGPSPSTRSDSPFGPMSPSATDRVFPIRSVVSVDPTPNALDEGRDGGDRRIPRTGGPCQ